MVDPSVPEPVGSEAEVVRLRRELDSSVTALNKAMEEVTAKLLAAPVGVLGVSSTGLEGDIAANLESMLETRTSLDAAVTLVATRADEDGEAWQGMRALLRTSGKAAEGEVNAAVRAGAYSQSYPALAELWLTGAISGAQVRHIGDLAKRLPAEHRDAAVELLASYAPSLTTKELAQASRAVINAVVPGWDERVAEREEKNAFLTVFPELDGFGIRGHLTVEQAGWVRTVLDAHTNVVASDDNRTRSERQAEALVTIMRAYATSDVIPNLALARPHFLVLTTAADLAAMANDAAPGDLARTVFGDQLDVTSTLRMLSDADVTPVLVDESPQVDESKRTTLADVALDAATAKRLKLAAGLLTKRRRSKAHAERRGAPPAFLRLLTTPVVPLALGRDVRIVPGWLRRAVTLRDLHCVVDGCDVPAHRCEIHHVQPWINGGATDIHNLATLCIRHHRGVDSGKWKLRTRVTGDGPGRYWLAEAC